MVRSLLYTAKLLNCEIWGQTMRQLTKLLMGTIGALLFVPTQAFAFALVVNGTSVADGDTVDVNLNDFVNFEFKGSANGIVAFLLALSRSNVYFQSNASLCDDSSPFDCNPDPTSLTFVGAMSGDDPLPDVPLYGLDANDPQHLVVLLGQQVDPFSLDRFPFHINDGLPDGNIAVSMLRAIAVTDQGATPVKFTYCAEVSPSLECVFEPGTAPSITVNINISGDPGTRVPEPATIWLAFAALIAGGAVFRNGSKRS